MKKQFIILIGIFSVVLLLTGCVNNKLSNKQLNDAAIINSLPKINNAPIIGGYMEGYGSFGDVQKICSTGYEWCEAKQKCLAIWEEKCENNMSQEEMERCKNNLAPKIISINPNPETTLENLTKIEIKFNKELSLDLIKKHISVIKDINFGRKSGAEEITIDSSSQTNTVILVLNKMLGPISTLPFNDTVSLVITPGIEDDCEEPLKLAYSSKKLGEPVYIYKFYLKGTANNIGVENNIEPKKYTLAERTQVVTYDQVNKKLFLSSGEKINFNSAIIDSEPLGGCAGKILLTPDDKKIIWSSDKFLFDIYQPETLTRLFIANINGTDKKLLVQTQGFSDSDYLVPIRFSIDGRYLYYHKMLCGLGMGGHFYYGNLWKVNINTGNGELVFKLPDTATMFNDISPDETKISYWDRGKKKVIIEGINNNSYHEEITLPLEIDNKLNQDYDLYINPIFVDDSKIITEVGTVGDSSYFPDNFEQKINSNL